MVAGRANYVRPAPPAPESVPVPAFLPGTSAKFRRPEGKDLFGRAPGSPGAGAPGSPGTPSSSPATPATAAVYGAGVSGALEFGPSAREREKAQQNADRLCRLAEKRQARGHHFEVHFDQVEVPRMPDVDDEITESAENVAGTRKPADAGDTPGSRGPNDPARRTVIVTNLPSGLDWKSLKHAFSVVGVVELCLMVDGTTYITFCDAESALKAVETYDGGKLDGQRIAVKLGDTARTMGGQRGGKKTVLATNLPSDLHWRNLKSACSVLGRVDLCRVKNGAAEISFRSSIAAEEALATFHGGILNGQRITVRFFCAATGHVLLPE